MDDAIEHLCKVMHDAYEQAAADVGWETQQPSRKPWAEVPEANKSTMRIAVAALLAEAFPVILADRDQARDVAAVLEQELASHSVDATYGYRRLGWAETLKTRGWDGINTYDGGICTEAWARNRAKEAAATYGRPYEVLSREIRRTAWKVVP